MLASVLLHGVVSANPAGGSVRSGRRLAEQVCATCHAIGGDQTLDPILRPPAPTFVSIAWRPGMSVSQIKRLLSPPHWQGQDEVLRMPDLVLLEDQKRDIAAYILSLKSTGSSPP